MAPYGDKHKMLPKLTLFRSVIRINCRENPLCDSSYARFLEQFSFGGGQQGLAKFDLAARKPPKPGIGRVGTLYQEQFAVVNDDSKNGHDGAHRRGWGIMRHVTLIANAQCKPQESQSTRKAVSCAAKGKCACPNAAYQVRLATQTRLGIDLFGIIARGFQCQPQRLRGFGQAGTLGKRAHQSRF